MVTLTLTTRSTSEMYNVDHRLLLFERAFMNFNLQHNYEYYASIRIPN